MIACLVLPGQQRAYAAPGDPFPEGPGLVFVAQGQAPGTPTTLYQAVQGAGAISFVSQGTAGFGYNAMGFRASDRYLYAIRNNDHLARIGQGGVATDLGAVAGLPSSGNFSYNQGTFGAGATADILYVRTSTSDNNLYAVDVTNLTATRIGLSTNVPNLSDFVWADGYIWGVYGEGQRLYRIDPNSGDVLSVPLPAGIPNDPYGAQWVYGNGNIGISNNRSGTVYQLHLNNPTSDDPSATLISSTRGPSNNQNDGAAAPGQSADLGITKEGPETWEPGQTITYTLRVHNYGPGDSSGYIIRDTLPANLGNPQVSDDCSITTEGGQSVVECAGAALANGSDGPEITITGTAPDTPGTDCTTDAISNSAQVVGNEADDNQANNSASSTACPAGETAPSFTVSKTAVSAPDFVGSGDRVTYQVTVVNTGTEAYTEDNPASFTDDLSDVTDDAQVDPDSLTGGAELTDGGVSWSGPLDVGESHTVSYTVQVNDPSAGNHILRNTVTPGPTGSCLSDDACTTTIPIAAFTVTKSADPTVATPGGTVQYTLTVTNTGAVDFGGTADPHAPPAHIEDSLADSLSQADYNGDASNGGTLQDDSLVWDLDLPVGATEHLTYSITVHSDVPPTATLTNTAVPGDYGRCATDDACTVTVPLRQFTVVKSVSPSEAVPGGTVTYTVTVTNTGSAPFTSDDPASFSDDLSDVLDDAEYNGDASGGATLSGTDLNWSGPLGAGEHATITYSVTVGDPGSGNGHLRNAVTPGPGGVCPTEAACNTDVPVTTVPPQQPSLTVRKQVDTDGPFKVGDTVAYTYTVTNTGNTDLDHVTVQDDRVSQVTCDESTLAPGASTTCHGVYEITRTALKNCDKDTGAATWTGGPGHRSCRITNTATATGTDPAGDQITSDPAQATITVTPGGGHHPPCKDHRKCRGPGHGHDHGGPGHGHKPPRGGSPRLTA